MGSLLLRLRTWWETADRTQKVVTVFGSAFLLMLLVGTVYFAGKPKMEVLLRDLSPQDQGMVVNELTKLGIPMEYDRSGAILVPANRVAEAQAQLAVKQKLPTSGHPGYSELRDFGAMNTPSVERERIKSTIEGELARSIETIQGVSAARIHLTFGEQSAFAREAKPSTASVIITENATSPLGPDQGKAIQRLVQYAVNGLDAKNITVVNNLGQTLIDGSMSSGAEGLASAKIGAEIAEARRREQALQRKLDAAFGQGNTVASVPILELNFDETGETRVERTPSKNPARIETSDENMGSGAFGGAIGPAGTASNMAPAAPPTGGAGSDRGYSGKQEAKEFETSQTTTNTKKAAGNLTRMSINVLVNTRNVKSAEAVRQMVEGELGTLLATDPERYSATVTEVDFDQSAQEEQKKESASAASAARMQQMLSILPIAALLVVGFMVVKAIAKTSRSQDVLVTAMPNGQMMLAGAGAGSGAGGNASSLAGALASRAEGGIAGIDPSVLAGSGPGGAIVRHNNEGLEVIDAISERVNIPLEQIKAMAAERPEAVAMLLKSWLLEDRR